MVKGIWLLLIFSWRLQPRLAVINFWVILVSNPIQRHHQQEFPAQFLISHYMSRISTCRAGLSGHCMNFWNHWHKVDQMTVVLQEMLRTMKRKESGHCMNFWNHWHKVDQMTVVLQEMLKTIKGSQAIAWTFGIVDTKWIRWQWYYRKCLRLWKGVRPLHELLESLTQSGSDDNGITGNA